MADVGSTLVQDEAIVLHVKNWQTADKYVICFTKEHGKERFIAYGARYVKNVQGRLLQPFACLDITLQPGQRVAKLRSCELLEVPKALDVKQMAYAAVIAELAVVLTEDGQPQPEIYELLSSSLKILQERNPRLVALAFAIKLLAITGFAPQITECVHCGRALDAEEEAWFSPLSGGSICAESRKTYSGEGLEHCAAGTRKLWLWLERLDFSNPEPFTVRGADLMELEKLLYKFIFFQTDKPLNSLNFLAQLGL